jgi:hypothetical protein
MADAAVGDLDFDLLVAERAGAERVAMRLWRAGRRRLGNWLFGFGLGASGGVESRLLCAYL